MYFQFSIYLFVNLFWGEIWDPEPKKQAGLDFGVGSNPQERWGTLWSVKSKENGYVVKKLAYGWPSFSLFPKISCVTLKKQQHWIFCVPFCKMRQILVLHCCTGGVGISLLQFEAFYTMSYFGILTKYQQSLRDETNVAISRCRCKIISWLHVFEQGREI